MLDDKVRKRTDRYAHRLVTGFLNRAIKRQQQRRQNGHTADDAEDDPLRHDDTQIHAEREGHKAQGNKACHCGQRRCRDRNNRLGNGVRHRFLFIRLELFLLPITVVEEDRVVHRDAELQHRNQRHRNKGNLSLNDVTAKIIKDCQTDIQQEQNRYQERIHAEHHHDAGQYRGDDDINRHFALDQ